MFLREKRFAAVVNLDAKRNRRVEITFPAVGGRGGVAVVVDCHENPPGCQLELKAVWQQVGLDSWCCQLMSFQHELHPSSGVGKKNKKTRKRDICAAFYILLFCEYLLSDLI